MLQNMLRDSHDDTVSSKRVIAFAAFVLCAVAFVANLFWNYKVDAFMFDAMIYLAMVGIGATAVEKFVPRRPADLERKKP
jgi:multisubunit Na+/H+ antiporter MnhF subunit